MTEQQFFEGLDRDRVRYEEDLVAQHGEDERFRAFYDDVETGLAACLRDAVSNWADANLTRASGGCTGTARGPAVPVQPSPVYQRPATDSQPGSPRRKEQPRCSSAARCYRKHLADGVRSCTVGCMVPRTRTAAPALAVASLVILAGCSSSGEEVPDADAVIEMVDYFEQDYLQDDAEFLVPPTPGVGTKALPTFRAPEGYTVALRCLSEEIPDATISDPEGVAAAKTEGTPTTAYSADIEHDTDRPCDRGSWGAGRLSTGGPVDVTITAGPDTYWVVAVTDDDGVDDDEPTS